MAVTILLSPTAKGFIKQQLALKNTGTCARVFLTKIG